MIGTDSFTFASQVDQAPIFVRRVAHALDLRGHGRTAGPGKLGQAGITAWHDMTADIKQLADIARAEHRDLPLIAFGRSDLLAGAVRQGCREPHRL